MNTTYIAEAAFVLPVSAAVAAFVAAFAAFAGRHESAMPVPVSAPATDLTGTGVWFRGIAKRGTTGMTYVPQSRGSTW